jgi:hypothetical protein
MSLPAILEALRVDVHESDVRVGERVALQHVAHDVLHEHGRAGADECDFWVGHGLRRRSGALLESCGEARDYAPQCNGTLQRHLPVFTDDGKPLALSESRPPCPFI